MITPVIVYIQFSLFYDEKQIIINLNLQVNKGDRIALQGKGGCGKSSILKAILSHKNSTVLSETFIPESFNINGQLEVASNLIISYVNQDTTKLSGNLNDFIRSHNLEDSMFKALLRHLSFERVQFEKNIDEYSEGQKKKLLIATSLLQKAHLYIWDEPLNYIDIFQKFK